MKKADLIKLAEDNEVELEDGMTVADIKAALDLADVDYSGDAGTIEVQLKRDVWDADGNRMRAPHIVSVPVEDAMDMVESGLAARVKK